MIKNLCWSPQSFLPSASASGPASWGRARWLHVYHYFDYFDDYHEGDDDYFEDFHQFPPRIIIINIMMFGCQFWSCDERLGHWQQIYYETYNQKSMMKLRNKKYKTRWKYRQSDLRHNCRSRRLNFLRKDASLSSLSPMFNFSSQQKSLRCHQSMTLGWPNGK